MGVPSSSAATAAITGVAVEEEVVAAVVGCQALVVAVVAVASPSYPSRLQAVRALAAALVHLRPSGRPPVRSSFVA